MESWENSEAKIIVKRGREKSLLNRHPWLFSGAVAAVKGAPEIGDIVTVTDSRGALLGKGFYNPKSQIRVRMLCFDDSDIGADFFRRRLEEAAQLRRRWFDEQVTNAFRLVHSDGDGLPGLIVDRYADVLVTQFNTAGIHRRRKDILAILSDLLTPAQMHDRSDAQALKQEGISTPEAEADSTAPSRVEIMENSIRFWVDIAAGQKTGFFLDQRDNRRLIREVANGGNVLNCFSYSGGFSVAAALGGSQTVSVDSSEPAIQLAKDNFTLNGLDTESHQFHTANVFEYLRQSSDEAEVVILDPPAFVKSKSHLDKGTRAYKDINRLAMQRLSPGGVLLTCSCSGLVDWRLFQQILFAAAKEAGRSVQILARPGQPADHPVNIYHPEGEYLKTFLLRVG